MKKYLIIIFLVVFFRGLSQNSVSLYHLGEYNSNIYKYNPAFSHNSKVYFGLPLFSSYSFSYSNGFSFSEGFSKNGSDPYDINLNSIVSALDGRGFHNTQVMSLDSDINLVSFGYRKENNIAFNFFANLRTINNFTLPINLAKFFAGGWAKEVNEGQPSSFNREFNDNIKAESISFIELGMGVSRSFLEDNLKIGGNIKLLYGLTYGEGNIDLSARADRATFNLNAEFNKYEMKGIFSEQGYSYFSPKLGLGFDLGASFNFKQISEIPIELSVSALDLGFIYMTDLTNSSAEKTNVNLDGTSLDAGQRIGTLLNAVFNPDIQTKTNDEFYTLMPRMITTATYHFNTKNKINGSMFNKFHSVGLNSNVYSLGYTKYFFDGRLAVSANGIKEDYQNPTIGMAANINIKSLQIFAATDNMLGAFNLSEMRQFQFNLGMTIALGRYRKKVIERYQDDWQWDEKPKKVFKILTKKPTKRAKEKSTTQIKRSKRNEKSKKAKSKKWFEL